jgi:hypothetical protein
MNYTVTTTDAKKVSVTITRRQLWDNYVDCWRDIAWDGEPMIDHLKKVHSVLVTASELNFVDLRKLFRSGDTVMLMGDAMQFLDNGVDNGVDILREIIVVDYTHKNVTIRHEDISF